MSAFNPENYAEALERAQSRPEKPRAVLKRRSDKAISRDVATGSAFPQKTGKALGRPRVSSRTAGRKDKKPTRAKKLTDGQLKKRVWKEFSIFIRTMGAGPDGLQQCFTCLHIAHWKTLEAGHLVPGRTNAVLFNELAVKPQCRRCNGHFRGNTIVYYPKLVALLGQQQVDDIVAQRDVTHKWQPGELLGLLEKYRALNTENPLVTENKS